MEKVEENLNKTIKIIAPFSVKEAEGQLLLNNPEWKVKFIGITIIESFILFSRDFYNRTLITPRSNSNWL
jgi:hypothetical protein